jgi:membrane-associated phospholipid phosphatase
MLIPAMALSRVYLGVHSPLDVIGGFAVGAGVVAGMRALPPVVRRFARFD